MSDITLIVLAFAGLFIVTFLGLRWSRSFKNRDPFDQWRRSSGNMLPDYDEQQSFIDKYSK